MKFLTDEVKPYGDKVLEVLKDLEDEQKLLVLFLVTESVRVAIIGNRTLKILGEEK